LSEILLVSEIYPKQKKMNKKEKKIKNKKVNEQVDENEKKLSEKKDKIKNQEFDDNEIETKKVDEDNEIQVDENNENNEEKDDKQEVEEEDGSDEKETKEKFREEIQVDEENDEIDKIEIKPKIYFTENSIKLKEEHKIINQTGLFVNISFLCLKDVRKVIKNNFTITKSLNKISKTQEENKIFLDSNEELFNLESFNLEILPLSTEDKYQIFDTVHKKNPTNETLKQIKEDIGIVENNFECYYWNVANIDSKHDKEFKTLIIYENLKNGKSLKICFFENCSKTHRKKSYKFFFFFFKIFF
jgi:hypothetical protein